MAVQQYTCPSCGAPITVENRFSKLVICQYCGQTSLVSPAGLDPTGSAATLADFPSILSVGASGTMDGKECKVLGRLRFKYEEGFWDEWFVLAGAQKIWLQEDEGTFTAFVKDTITTPVPPFESIVVGSTISVNGREVFVVEKNEAVIAGGEGELYFKMTPGERVDYVDGNSGGRVVSIEFAADEINLSIGNPIDPERIVLEPKA